MKKTLSLMVAIVLLSAGVAAEAAITGNPLLDGWTAGGNSLQNGVYIRGTGNYGFDTYSAAMEVTAGSALEISDGANSWLAGDTVLGAGGMFTSITAAEAGWTAFTGGAVNAALGVNTKFLVKFGSSAATFSSSTISPHAGNGLGSMGTNGGSGAVQVCTSGRFNATQWRDGSGTIQLLDKASHIERNGASTPDADVARLIWNWNASAGYVDSWQILLNTSLLRRLDPTFAGSDPAAGNNAIVAVQRRDDGFYTDALVTIPAAPVPEPASIVALGGGILGLLPLVRRRR